MTPAGRLDEDVVLAYSELGVERLVVAPPPRLSLDDLAGFVESNAPSRLGASLA